MGFGAGSPTGPGGTKTAALAQTWSCPVRALFDRVDWGGAEGAVGLRCRNRSSSRGWARGEAAAGREGSSPRAGREQAWAR